MRAKGWRCGLVAVTALGALAAAGCSTARIDSRPTAGGATEWTAAIRPADRDRLVRLGAAWSRALAQARAAGFGAQLAALGTLAEPDAALDGPAPPPGRYHCRVVKLGAQQPGMLDYVAYPYFACFVGQHGARLSLRKLTGSQRPVGTLWPDSERRMIFLGTLGLGTEMGIYPYGADSERDMVGVFERIGEQRWRLVLPWPRWESNLDLIELIP